MPHINKLKKINTEKTWHSDELRISLFSDVFQVESLRLTVCRSVDSAI
jgi:hypothetical protein